jgi:hypothetical protein
MIREFMWLSHGKPIPDGWVYLDGQMNSHHHAHSVLITREIENAATHPIPAAQTEGQEWPVQPDLPGEIPAHDAPA